jgi:hypothetical protein
MEASGCHPAVMPIQGKLMLGNLPVDILDKKKVTQQIHQHIANKK